MWPFKKTNLQDEALPRQQAGLKLKISGMHCSSCAMNIDNAVEEIPDVISSQTNYARGEAKVIFKPGELIQARVEKVIESLGYKVL